MKLTPIVVHYDGETLVFNDGEAFVDWINTQETVIAIEVEPRDEYL